MHAHFQHKDEHNTFYLFTIYVFISFNCCCVWWLPLFMCRLSQGREVSSVQFTVYQFTYLKKQLATSSLAVQTRKKLLTKSFMRYDCVARQPALSVFSHIASGQVHASRRDTLDGVHVAKVSKQWAN